MTKNQSKCLGLVLFLLALTLNLSSAEAQISVYEKLTGTQQLFSNEIAQQPNSAGLTIKMKAGYDDLLRKATQFEEIKLARWTYGASVDWRTSANQSWHFDLHRAGKTFRAVQFDSSWNFQNLIKTNLFRVTHQRKLGRLPIILLSYLQVYDHQKTQWNYGVGIQGRLNNYRFGFEGEYKSWFPFFQTFSSNNLYQIEVLFPSLANIRQLRWSVAGSLIGFNFESFIRTGKLVPSSRQEREYTFMPSAEVQTFMGSLQKTFASSWQTNLKFILDQIKGDGILRFRDRKYGSIHLHTFRFYDVRFSINQREKPGNYEFGIAYQRLSGKTNASIESWPFDDSGVDFFREKQSLVGSGHIALSRTWLQSFLKLSKVFYINLLAEYIHVKPDVRLRTWGSALIFGTGQVEQHVFDNNQNFLRIGISPKLKLSKNLNIEFLLNQWIPIDKKATARSKGGRFGQVILSYNM
ncbi:hypothetical protein IH879_08350 [candidate division KSB1 bacterium]|nr:hypothetical protein [candidate division KSB1 bacterium]